MSTGQSTNGLLVELLKSVTALTVKVDMLGGLPDRLTFVETKLAALESKIVAPDLLEGRFKAVEEGVSAVVARVAGWEARVKAVWDTLMKIGGAVVLLVTGVWALFTYWKHG